jgi:tetratricopeptide (TPR) repeat protein
LRTRLESNLQRFPDQPGAHARLARLLRRLYRFDEAEAILLPALLRFARDFDLACERARLVRDRGDTAAALALWQDLAAEHPKRSEGRLGIAAAQQRLGQLEEADASLAYAVERFPRALAAFEDYARNAELRSDMNEALRRWQMVRDRFPATASGYAGTGGALASLGRLDEAEALLATAFGRFRASVAVGLQYARVAELRQDREQLETRWRELRARFPGDLAIARGWTETVMRTGLSDAAVTPPGAAKPVSDLPNAELMLRFESLGENCEFGFVQRYFGAEPLGLLRWAAIPVERLISGLEASFAGVGAPENTIVFVDPNTHEYGTTDKRYEFDLHGGISTEVGSVAEVSPRLNRRAVFLKDKLINCLNEGDTIFVFQTDGELDPAVVMRLHWLIQRYNSANALLYVAPAAAGQTAGAVDRVAPRLYRGFLDRAGFDGTDWRISFELWLQLCRKAVELADAGNAVAVSEETAM